MIKHAFNQSTKSGVADVQKTPFGHFFLFWVILAINPVDPGIWALENFLVVTLFPLVLWLDRHSGICGFD